MNIVRPLLYSLILILGVSCFQNKSYTWIPLHYYHKSAFPFVELEIEGKCIPCVVDLGATGFVAVREEILQGIKQKKFIKQKITVGIKSHRYENPVFLIPNLKLGGWSFKDTQVEQESDEFRKNAVVLPPTRPEKDAPQDKTQGRLGSQFFTPYCCLFDFFRAKIVIAKDKNVMGRYTSLSRFFQMPFEQTSGGHVFLTVTTDAGTHRFLLDTCANFSAIRQSLISPQSNIEVYPSRKFFVSNKLVLSGVDSGSWKFFIYEFDEWKDIDGILGLDFFYKHEIILDFQTKTAYIKPPRSFFEIFSKSLLLIFFGPQDTCKVAAN